MTCSKNKKTIVLDNVIFSLQRSGGVSVYWGELLKRVLCRYDDIKIIEYKNDNLLRNDLKINIKSSFIIFLPLFRYFPAFYQSVKKKHIFHSSYYRTSCMSNAINIVTVHDFTYEYYFSGLSKFIHSLQKKIALKNADGIICISNNTKKDLLDLYSFVDEDDVEVIYNGVSDKYYNCEFNDFSIFQKYKAMLKKTFILFVGGRVHYKNFDKFIESVSECKYQVVIVGGGELSEGERVLLKNFNIDYVHFSYVDEGDLNFFYNNAFCLVYPSSYEGFGIPVIEAMKAGCPVIALNSSSIPEVSGGAAILLNEISKEFMERALLKLADEAFRCELIAKGIERSSIFSWDLTFQKTFDYYHKIWEKKCE